ncbi:MAG: sigma-70 family RNA polymerase sigma factor, partial [Candidatus Promineifilaceae bacterium]
KPNPEIVSVEDKLDGIEKGYSVPKQFFDWCCLPEEDFDSEEVRQKLESAIGELSPTLGSVFILREMEGLSTRETADTLDVSEDVVKTRLRRARLQLRELLSTYFAEYNEAI